MNLPNRIGVRLAAVAMALGLVAGLGACGDDSTEPQSPVLTNEEGYETFEPEAPPIQPETGEPTPS